MAIVVHENHLRRADAERIVDREAPPDAGKAVRESTMIASSIPWSVATATAAVAFSTLCSPGMFSATSRGPGPSGTLHREMVRSPSGRRSVMR
jgi:hypothetical protein